ncbi:hypothetical protein B0J18DRAFT_437264 [Chaetomium sp. MPI-SDFR-AT-0129]|nr:hypothetical protein B0J18DRAFT_437264 [Chaetomium sp. MPI-SDFR-AT-0129]
MFIVRLKLSAAFLASASLGVLYASPKSHSPSQQNLILMESKDHATHIPAPGAAHAGHGPPLPFSPRVILMAT